MSKMAEVETRPLLGASVVESEAPRKAAASAELMQAKDATETMARTELMQAKDATETMGQYSAADYGWSYVDKAEPAAGSCATAADDESPKEPFEGFKYTDQWRASGSGFLEDKQDRELLGAAALCGLCGVVAIGLVVAGSLVLAWPQYAGTAGTSLPGMIVLGVGSTLVLSTLACACALCVMACARGGSTGGGSPRRARFELKRLNDAFEREVEAYDNLRFNVGANSKAFQAKREAEDKAKQSLKRERADKGDTLIKEDLDKGLSTSEVQNRRRPSVFKIVFDGDIMVSSIDELRDEVSIVLAAGSKHDTVCLVLTSPGGAVTMYGLAAAQLARVRKAGMQLVVCVDSVAASGGYLMATMANRIVAAPFALVGSIGVISIVPNVHKLLEKHDVNTYVFTAGKYKRTVDVIGEVTEAGKAKVVEELEEIHKVFKEHIVINRPSLRPTIDEVATGEAWLAIEGRKKGLVDEIMTSDEFLLAKARTHDIINVEPKKARRFPGADLLEQLARGAFGATPASAAAAAAAAAAMRPETMMV